MRHFSFKLNDVFCVKGEDGNTLLYQITNADLSNLEVSVNAPRDASTGNIELTEVKLPSTIETLFPFLSDADNGRKTKQQLYHNLESRIADLKM